MSEKLNSLTNRLEKVKKDKIDAEIEIDKSIHEYVVHYTSDLNEKLNRLIAEIMAGKRELIEKYLEEEESGSSNHFQNIKDSIQKEISKVSYREDGVKELIKDYIYNQINEGKKSIHFNSVIPNIIPNNIDNILQKYGFMNSTEYVGDMIKNEIIYNIDLSNELDGIVKKINHLSSIKAEINRLNEAIEKERFLIKNLGEFIK